MKTRFKIFFTFYLLICLSCSLNAAYFLNPPDSTKAHLEPFKQEHKNKKFSFTEVDQLINESITTSLLTDDLADIFRKEEEFRGNPKVIQAQGILDKITEGKLIGKLTGAELLNLPVGIKKVVGNTEVTIAFASAKIYPEFAQLEAYAKLVTPDGKSLIFGSQDLKFSSEGGLIGESSLGLLGDFPIAKGTGKIAILLNQFHQQDNGNHEGTFIRIDCDGFVNMQVQAELHISREWIQPATDNGNIIPGNQRVSTHFTLNVSDFNDMVINVDMPHFVISGAPDIAFNVDDAVVDFSDFSNAPNFLMPPTLNPNTGEWFIDPDPVLQNLWRGVYFKNIEVILPEAFKDDGGNSLKFGAENLYIDSRGVVGKFYVENILPYDTGNIGNWAFSVDLLSVDLFYSQVFGFDFNGKIGIPIVDHKAPLKYEAFADIQHNFYNFGIGVDSIVEFPVFNSTQVKLYKGSKINVTVENGNFTPSAMLCGQMSIKLNGSQENQNTNLEIAQVSFEKLIVVPEAPFLGLHENGGSITFHSGPVLNNSVINIDFATLQQLPNNEIMFAMGMEAGVMAEEDGGAKTGGAFGLIGALEYENGRHLWRYDRIKLISLEVEMDFSDAGYIRGQITFFSDDPIYGNGFYGALDGGFIRQGNDYKLNVTASARFGAMNPHQEDAYKYWSFDVYISSSSLAVTIYPPVQANGFGGGAYHHMRLAEYDLEAMASSGTTNPYSGLIYVPDESTALGVKVSLGIKLQQIDAFKGVVTLEMAFTDKLSLREIMLYGQGEFIAESGLVDPKSRLGTMVNSLEQTLQTDEIASELNKQNKITAALFLRLNFEGGLELHGSFGAFVEAANGRISGEGIIDLLISPKTNKFHYYIGGYTDQSITNIEGQTVPPVNASIKFGAFEIAANFYIMGGNDLPGPPPISQAAANYFDIPASTNNRNLLTSGGRDPAMGTSAAFGAGAYFDFRYEKNKNKYIDFQGQAGFDLVILSNSDLSSCAVSGHAPHGLNGWRANGRIYAFLHLSGKWKVVGIGFKLPELNAGVLLTGDLPNPSFFNARGSIKWNYLDFSYDENIGQMCGQVLN